MNVLKFRREEQGDTKMTKQGKGYVNSEHSRTLLDGRLADVVQSCTNILHPHTNILSLAKHTCIST